MVLAFPPCTYLSCSGNRWFNVERYGDKARQRLRDRERAIGFFMAFTKIDCPYVAIENPIGIISSYWRKPDQIIQPYWFGDFSEKRTCLWLKGLPPLTPTNIVEPPARTTYASGKSMPTWYADAFRLPPKERSRIRSQTFPGVAKAMAEQWGGLLCSL